MPENAASTNESLLSATLNKIPEKILLLDESGDIIFANKAWDALLGFARRQQRRVPNNGIRAALTALSPAREHTEELHSAFDELVGNIRQDFYCTFRTAAERWLHLHATRLDDDTASRFLIVVDDITDAHRYQNSLKNLSLQLANLKEQERRRIALDLHDSTAQHLSAIGLNLLGLKKRLRLSKASARVFNDIEQSLDSAMHELQITNFLLYPSDLESYGLAVALESFARGFARLTGIHVKLHANPADELTIDRQRTLMRVIQEALTNVYRHAQASHASVRLKITRRHALLYVADNGRGIRWNEMPSPSKISTGIGISGMHARIDEVGGELRVKSQPGKGTRIVAMIPLIRTRRPSSRADRRTSAKTQEVDHPAYLT